MRGQVVPLRFAATAFTLAILTIGGWPHQAAAAADANRQDQAVRTPSTAGTAQHGPATAAARIQSSSDASADLHVLPTKTAAEIARDGLPAVVQVITRDASDDTLRRGSGFIVTPDGSVVTSHHVLRGARRAEVVLSTGDVYDVVSVAAEDLRHDLVVLRIAGSGLPVLPLGDVREVALGEPVTVIGSPLGLANTVSNGLVSAMRDMDGSRIIQISAPISQGSSGGPVFDSHGRVIGVLAGYYPRGQNINFAVPVDYVRGLLGVPARDLPVLTVGRKRSSLFGDQGSNDRNLSLEAVLRGEKIPGEEDTPWALEPRRVDLERVKSHPVVGPSDLVGEWEVRELSRVPDMKSGVYRGVLASDNVTLKGAFFGGLIDGTAYDVLFEARWVRHFEGEVEPSGRAILRSEHGCTYYLRASAQEMAGVYECVDDRGTVYDLGAVEAVRIQGVGPSGVYSCSERTVATRKQPPAPGEAVLFALPDGRWVGMLMQERNELMRVYDLDDGHWTGDGHLSAFLNDDRLPASGTFTPGRFTLRYAIGGRDYDDVATLEAEMKPAGNKPDGSPGAGEPAIHGTGG